MKVCVLMNTHKSLHDGHYALLNYAKSLGEVYAHIIIDPFAVRKYCQSGEISHSKTDKVTEMKKELDALEIPQTYISLSNNIIIDEGYRQYAYKIASSFVHFYKDYLLTPTLQQEAVVRMMSRLLDKGSNSSGTVIEVAGPEIMNFFIKSALPLLGLRAQVEIFPKIIKDSIFKLRCQSALREYRDLLLDEEELSRLTPAILGAKDRFKIGRNEELVEELNDAYVGRSWKWSEILVWENKFVSGRLELIRFSFRAPIGICILEEIYYEN